MLIRLSGERVWRSPCDSATLLKRRDMNVEEPAEVRQANYDAHSAMLSSFLDLRISYLRVCVDAGEPEIS